MLSAARYLSSLDSKTFNLEDHRLFEYCCAWNLSQHGYNVLLWDDINPDIKDSWNLPEQDVGVDYATIDGFNDPSTTEQTISQQTTSQQTIFGQAKCYRSGGYISSHDVNRTMLCAGWAGVRHIEFATKPNNKLGTPKILLKYVSEWDNFINHTIRPMAAIQTVIPDSRFEEFHAACIAKIPEIVQSDTIIQMDLRECQKQALSVMSKNARIKMACGSGKSYTVLRHILEIKQPGKKYLILVPSLILMHQWAKVFETAGFQKISKIGTNNDREYNQTKDIHICVYKSFPKWIDSADIDALEHIYIDEAHHIDKANGGYLLDIKQVLDLDMFPHTMLSATIRDADYEYPMRQAIDDGILTDYDVMVPIYDVINSKSLKDIIIEHPEYMRVLIYFNSIASARAFAAEFGSKCAVITCEETLNARTKILDDFKSGKYRVISSVNTLGEGVDLKCADTCIFGDYRSSEISIVQCVGRILRQFPGKNMSHVVVPMSLTDIENNISPEVLRILTKLAKNDLKLLHKIQNARTSSTSRITIIDKTAGTTDEFSKISELLLERTFELSHAGAWMFKLGMLQQYYDEFKRFPNQRETYKNVKLGYWLYDQKRFEQKGTLHETKITKLNSINHGWNNTKDDAWEEKAIVFGEYFETFQKLPAAKTKFQGIGIGKWLFDNRMKNKNGQLSESQVRTLDSITNTWSITIEDIWYEYFAKLQTYYETNNELPPSKYVIDGLKLGPWLSMQKTFYKNNKLLDERIQKLDSITPDWRSKYTWDDRFDQFK